MKTYAIKSGFKLVLSVDGAEWQTVEFREGDFGDIGKATATEVAAAVAAVPGLATVIDDVGRLELHTVSRGAGASLEVDVNASTAAPALGLPLTKQTGSGPPSARLVSNRSEPFVLSEDTTLKITVDDARPRRISFKSLKHPEEVSAAEVVEAINKRGASVATALRDGRVVLSSPTFESGSSVSVDGDAATALGFEGDVAATFSDEAKPAVLCCSGSTKRLKLVNLTTTSLEVHLPGGVCVLDPQGRVDVSPCHAASVAVARLRRRGLVKVIRVAD